MPETGSSSHVGPACLPASVCACASAVCPAFVCLANLRASFSYVPYLFVYIFPYSVNILFLLLLLLLLPCPLPTIASITNDKHLPLTVASDSFHHAICYACYECACVPVCVCVCADRLCYKSAHIAIRASFLGPVRSSCVLACWRSNSSSERTHSCIDTGSISPFLGVTYQLSAGH